MGRDSVVVIGIVAPFTPRGSVSGENSSSRDPGGGVNVFVCVDNGLPAALTHASPRVKIPMTHHWCGRVTPRAGYPWCCKPAKALVFEKLGKKGQGDLGEVQNED